MGVSVTFQTGGFRWTLLHISLQFFLYLFIYLFILNGPKSVRCTRSAGRVCSDYWKGVILHLRVWELQLYTIINFCLAPIRFHSTLDVSTVTVHGSRLAIQHVLSCQSEPPSQAACLRPTTRPINSYWLWHTCPSKMSSSVLIFPESCSLPSHSPTLSCPPRVRSLSWQIVYVASYSERRCFAARRLGGGRGGVHPRSCHSLLYPGHLFAAASSQRDN